MCKLSWPLPVVFVVQLVMKGIQAFECKIGCSSYLSLEPVAIKGMTNTVRQDNNSFCFLVNTVEPL